MTTFADLVCAALTTAGMGVLAYAVHEMQSVAGRLERFEGKLDAELDASFEQGAEFGKDGVDTDAIFADGWNHGYAAGIEDVELSDVVTDPTTGETLAEVDLVHLGYTEAEEDELHRIYDAKQAIVRGSLQRLVNESAPALEDLSEEVTAVDVFFTP